MGDYIWQWDLILPQVEFSYDQSSSQTTDKGPFEVVYGCNPISTVNLVSLSINQSYSRDADERAKYIKKLYGQVMKCILKKILKYEYVNKHREAMIYNKVINFGCT